MVYESINRKKYNKFIYLDSVRKQKYNIRTVLIAHIILSRSSIHNVMHNIRNKVRKQYQSIDSNERQGNPYTQMKEKYYILRIKTKILIAVREENAGHNTVICFKYISCVCMYIKCRRTDRKRYEPKVGSVKVSHSFKRRWKSQAKWYWKSILFQKL